MTKLGAQVYDVRDFTKGNSSAPIPPDGSLIGAGVDKTVIVLSSVAATRFAHLNFPDTSPYNVQRVQPLSGPRLKNPVISDLTIRVLLAPPVAPDTLFAGLRLASADGAVVKNVLIQGVIGSLNTPPGETFGLSLVNCSNTLLQNVEVDGKGVGGCGIGLNRCTNVWLRGCRSHHAGHSHGYSAWQCKGVDYAGCIAYANGSGTGGSGGVGFNHEDTDAIAHYGSASYGNSLASHRYYSSSGSRKAVLVGAYGDAPIMLDTKQAQADLTMTECSIPGFVTRHQ